MKTTRPPIPLQDLRRRIYLKAKAEKTHRFWGIYVHVCKLETLREAYGLAKKNNGAPGIDGVTFKEIEDAGLADFLGHIQKELIDETYRPMRARLHDIPKDGGKSRTLSIPTIKDRVVQGALKLIIEPIFEADFQAGSYGFRPRRRAHQAIEKVGQAIVRGQTLVIDVDIEKYFDTVRHHILFAKCAKRIYDPQILHLIKLIVKAAGKKGVGQGSVIAPLFANIYLNELDEQLEAVKTSTASGEYSQIEYARYADDLVILTRNTNFGVKIAASIRQMLDVEMTKLELKLNEEKTYIVNLEKGESFAFLGFEFRRTKTRSGKWGALKTPRAKARKAVTQKIKDIFARFVSQPVARVIELINPILRGWTNYFRVGNSSRVFSYIKHWVEKKVRRHMARAKKRFGFGWKRWSTDWLYQNLGLYNDYQIRYYQDPKALTSR